MCNDGPDTSGMNQAAVDSAQLGRDSFDWFKNYVSQTQPQRDETTRLNNQIAGQQLTGMNLANTQAQELYNRNKNVYQPLEDDLIAKAKAYDTPEREQAAATGAMSDVQQAAARNTMANNRALARTGVAPGSARSASMNGDQAMMTALGEQAAGDTARRNTQATGHAMEMDAAGLGKNVIGNQATMLQTGGGLGAQAVGANGAALTSATSAAPLMQTGYGQNMQGTQIAGNLYGQQAQLQMQGQGGLLGGIGGIMQGVGAMYGSGMFSSSKKVKEKKTPVSGKAALEAVEKTPIEGWDYKPGEGDEGTHVGGYAEDMQRNMGDDVAPGGKVVNLPKMAQVNGGAIKELAAQLAQVEKQIKALEAA